MINSSIRRCGNVLCGEAAALDLLTFLWNYLAGEVVVNEQEESLKGVKDGEDVVGRKEQRAVAEKSKPPGDAQKAEKTQKRENPFLGGVLGFCFFRCKVSHLHYNYYKYS